MGTRLHRVALALLMVALLTGCAGMRPPAPQAPLLGWTHERGSPDRMPSDTGGQARAERAMALLREHAPLQNAQILGWGLPSPSPAPGHDDFAALDRRVAMMVKTARVPVITLCCAPEWMKGDGTGLDEQQRFEQPPRPERFADFAALAARIAARYPEVRHFMVWNEMKGFWDAGAGRWNAQAYTTLYNEVWRAIKAVRPDARVGGPYVVLDSHRLGTPLARDQGSDIRGAWGTIDRRSIAVIEHWLAHKIGADFIAIDASVMAKDGRLDVDVIEGQRKFVALQDWIRARTPLPIWWAELYPVPPALPEAQARAAALEALRSLRRHPPAAVLFWDPACHDNPGYGRAVCLWNDRDGKLEPAPLTTMGAWREPPAR